MESVILVILIIGYVGGFAAGYVTHWAVVRGKNSPRWGKKTGSKTKDKSVTWTNAGPELEDRCACGCTWRNCHGGHFGPCK